MTTIPPLSERMYDLIVQHAIPSTYDPTWDAECFPIPAIATALNEHPNVVKVAARYMLDAHIKGIHLVEYTTISQEDEVFVCYRAPRQPSGTGQPSPIDSASLPIPSTLQAA